MDGGAGAENYEALLLGDPLTQSQLQMQRRQVAYKRALEGVKGEMLFNFLVFLVVSIFLMVDRDEKCDQNIQTWLIVITGYYVGDFIVLLGQFNYLKKMRRENFYVTISRFFFSCFLVGWLIYGNVMYFKNGSNCSEKAPGLNTIMFFILLLGYFEMLKCCCMGTCVCIMLPVMFFAVRRARRPAWVPAAPQFLQNLAR